MQQLNHGGLKHSFTTHPVPLESMVNYAPLTRVPQMGDLILAEIVSLGKHTSIEVRTNTMMYLFPGDRIVGVFGNRYATDQFEGYVPAQPVDMCDLLSVGGVCGELVSAHKAMGSPTRLRILGNVCDAQGTILNQRSFGLPITAAKPHGEVILVVGSSMNSGKTTTVGTLARALSQAGFRVAATKVTGTAAGKDCRYFTSCGADPVLDFTDVGYPSTYMLSLDELLTIYMTLLNHLRTDEPDYTIIEIADGIFQRETRMLLENDIVHSTVDHIFFAANDSLAIDSGVRYLHANHWPLRSTTGAITQSPLAVREAEAISGIPCLTIDQIMAGELLPFLQGRLQREQPKIVMMQRAA